MTGFCKRQISDLRELGVTSRQLHELQRILPSCRAWITAPLPPMRDVRDELAALHKTLQTALKALRRWESGRVKNPALAEARARVLEAAFDHDDKGTVIGDAMMAVWLAMNVTEAATAGVPKQQRRRVASHVPIYWIHEALLRGWGHTHYSVGSGDLPADVPRGAAPPFPHTPSSGETSAFRKIVCICFDAALGTRDNDPERAIKAFIRGRAARKRAQGRQAP